MSKEKERPLIGTDWLPLPILTYGVLKLRQMQTLYDERCPVKKDKDRKKDKKKDKDDTEDDA